MPLDDATKPRARTVFQRVKDKQGIPEEAAPVVTPPPPVLVAEKPPNELVELATAAAKRERSRFAALAGVLGTHLLTGVGTMPVICVGLKIAVGSVMTAFGLAGTFTWLQAMLLSVGLGTTGPLAFFIYRYWSGKF